VIDDDELSRELLAMLIGAEGHEVEVAASGEEALARLNAAGEPLPDVVLSDMQLPGVSGDALAKGLRGASGGKARLLAMSGSQPAEAMLRGFDGFLLKPFSMEDLDTAFAETQKGIEVFAAGNGASEGRDDSNVPALNEDIYAKMAKMMPGTQLGEMYAMCLADARKRLAQLVTLAEAGDDDGFRRTAHTVKGGCGMIGATELYSLAEAAERDGLAQILGQAVGTSRVTTLLQRFSHACDRLERILGERM